MSGWTHHEPAVTERNALRRVADQQDDVQQPDGHHHEPNQAGHALHGRAGVRQRELTPLLQGRGEREAHCRDTTARKAATTIAPPQPGTAVSRPSSITSESPQPTAAASSKEDDDQPMAAPAGERLRGGARPGGKRPGGEHGRAGSTAGRRAPAGGRSPGVSRRGRRRSWAWWESRRQRVARTAASVSAVSAVRRTSTSSVAATAYRQAAAAPSSRCTRQPQRGTPVGDRERQGVPGVGRDRGAAVAGDERDRVVPEGRGGPRRRRVPGPAGRRRRARRPRRSPRDDRVLGGQPGLQRLHLAGAARGRARIGVPVPVEVRVGVGVGVVTPAPPRGWPRRRRCRRAAGPGPAAR